MRLINKMGFTLIELIIVVVIIGILAAIAAPMMNSVNTKAMLTEVETGLSAIATSMQEYYAENDGYPFPHVGHGWISGLIEMNGGSTSCFPGLAIRNPGQYGSAAIGGGPATLDGVYISQDCFSIAFGNDTSTPPVICYEANMNKVYGNTVVGLPPKYADISSTVDDTAQIGELYYDMSTKQYYQYNWSKTGAQQGPFR